MSDAESEGTPLTSRQAKHRYEKDKKKAEKEFFGKICGLGSTLIISLIALVLCNILSLAGIIIGSLYLDKSFCPGSPHLAAILIVAGALALILSIFEGRTRVQGATGEEEGESNECGYALLCLLRLAKICVFIYLCVLVFSLRSVLKVDHPGQVQVDEGNATLAEGNRTLVDEGEGIAITEIATHSSHYCHPTLYFFSFWTVLLILVGAAVSLVIACCVCCVGALFVVAATA